MQWIDPGVLQRTGELRRRFEQARPFRHLVLEPFFDWEYCRKLCEQFPGFDAARARNELGEAGGKAVHTNLASLGPAYAQFDQMLQSTEFLGWLAEATGIPKLLYDAEYVGGGTHENLHGQDLDTHVDFNYHPATRWHRRLNLIVFLNGEWEAEWGGLLELQKDPALPATENEVATVLPRANCCVIFETTETSWHGFRRIALPADKRHLSRRSIAVYFYTRARPAEETAPGHGTIYVPRPVPDFVQAGHTLVDDEVYELQVQFARRDAQIRYLYDREQEFSRIAQSPSFRLARALTWPLRKLRDWRTG